MKSAFEFLPTVQRPGRSQDGTTFTVDRLWRSQAGRLTEISHLIDRTYDYRSMRELRWHLAERFGQPTDGLTRRAA